MSDHSVTHWLAELKEGDEDAANQLWERYYGQLVRLARQRLGKHPRRVVDEEDVALSAFDVFCRNASDGKFPNLKDRDDLWKLLITITDRKTHEHVKFQRRQKRGGGNVRGQSVFANANESGAGNWDNVAITNDPSPAFAAELAEQFERALDQLQDASLREVALQKMASHTNEEIADSLGCSVRTVKRKLHVIRAIWSDGQD